MHRSCASQIEFWAEIGKIAEENPELSYSFIKETLLAVCWVTMNLTIKQTNLFKKRMKNLPEQQKIELDNAVKTIFKNPYVEDLKKGNLSFSRVYKFQINKQLMLLGYHYKKKWKKSADFDFITTW